MLYEDILIRNIARDAVKLSYSWECHIVINLTWAGETSPNFLLKILKDGGFIFLFKLPRRKFANRTLLCPEFQQTSRPCWLPKWPRMYIISRTYYLF